MIFAFIFLLNFVELIVGASIQDEKPESDQWKGKWFPFNPVAGTADSSKGIPGQMKCDDDEGSIESDFNFNEIELDFNQFVCLANQSRYDPNPNINPIQKEHIIPPAFQASVVCTNEVITYPHQKLPTYGSFRPYPPVYGDFKFLPIQRWMHTLKLGGIVALYHPCANKMEVNKLKTSIQSCLYSHVITPSNLLTPERPLAVLSYGRSLEMSVHVPRLIRDFIRNKKESVKVVQGRRYDKGLIKEAKLVTTLDDTNLCPFSE